MRPLRFLVSLTAILGLLGPAMAAENSAPKRVALVFDDGPTTEQCRAFLDLLAREHVTVTFSHVGEKVAAHPALAHAVAAAGHEIANHSYTHPHLKDMPADAIKRELLDAQAAIVAATGQSPRWLWTPFLEWNDGIAQVVGDLHLKHLPLSHLKLVSSDDWNTNTSAEKILHNATTGISDQTVILCHEWRAETLAQLPAILAELRRQGCQFLTFSQLAATLTPEQLAGLR